MYNYTCPACGANLDPGEKCDCGGESAKKFGSPDANQTDPKATMGNIPVDKTSIAQNFVPVKGVDVRNLRLAKNIPAKAMVATVRKRFPGYDESMQSKVERPDYYGVRLLPEAEDALIREYAPEAINADRRKDRHKIKNRMSFRPPDGLHKRLIEFAAQYHYASINACLIDLVRIALAKEEETDHDAV